MEKLTLKEQLRFYFQWCIDNKRNAKDFKSLNDYIAEISNMGVTK